VLALPLEIHVHFNESLKSCDTKTTGSYCLKNHRTCSKAHHLYIICSIYLSPARTRARRRWRYVVNRTFDVRRDSDCSL